MTRVLLVLLTVFLALAIAAPLALGLQKGLERHEHVECIEWLHQADTYPDFFLTEWQAEQCKHHGFHIEGIPVK